MRIASLSRALSMLVLVGFANSCRLDVPATELLGPLSGPTDSFRLTVRHHPPYQFLIGVPRRALTSGRAPRFEGLISLRQGTRLVASFPISSDTCQSSNWLDRRSPTLGYILTWHSRYGDRPFSSFIETGRVYAVDVSFTVLPPTGATLWFSSIEKGYSSSGPPGSSGSSRAGLTRRAVDSHSFAVLTTDAHG